MYMYHMKTRALHLYPRILSGGFIEALGEHEHTTRGKHKLAAKADEARVSRLDEIDRHTQVPRESLKILIAPPVAAQASSIRSVIW